ncbi:MAG: hypothetical protein F4X79_00410 [Acidobacteria bacterium]|nr:hypothetical protein [Acidobacteriota bacterium]
MTKGLEWSHGISENELKTMGEIVLQWSAADCFIGNSLNFMFQVTDETMRRETCAWSLRKKLQFLANVPTTNPHHTLVTEIRRHGLACLGERNRVAHSYALRGSGDGHAFLEAPQKGRRTELSSLQHYAENARRVCGLALKLNAALAAPWIVDAAWFDQSRDP